MTEYPEVTDDALDESDHYFLHVVKNLKLKLKPISLDCKETAGLMMGRCELSQRSYKVLKKILGNNRVIIPSYDKVRNYCINLDTGPINSTHEPDLNCMCMSYGCEMNDTLQRIASTEALFKCFRFPTTLQQEKLANFLKSENKDLYKSF